MSDQLLGKPCLYSRPTETVTGTSNHDNAVLERDLAVLCGREVGHVEMYFVP